MEEWVFITVLSYAMFQWTGESVNILSIEKLHQEKQTGLLSITPENNQKEKVFVVFKRL